MSKSRSTADYREKRDFRKTPEPKPDRAVGRRDASIYVVHRHEARRLHYDLRIEADGVLKSWAIPKGFSYNPADKRLAVHTEDHPIQYEDFEGIIPKGEYGAGTMTIWDKGRYQVLKHGDVATAVAKGELKIMLKGLRLRGEWHLVRTKDRENHWLLFKARDRYARQEQDFAPQVDLGRATKGKMPERLRVMRPQTKSSAFSQAGWLFEAGLQGCRLVACKVDTEVSFRTARGQPLNIDLGEIANDLQRIRAENVLLDGMLVVPDENLRPSRYLLDRVLAGTASHRLYYYIFDLLYYDEWDLRKLALIDRKTVLAGLLPQLKSVLYVDHVADSGMSLAAAISQAGLNSIIAKKSVSSYVAGRSASWLEIDVEPRKGTQRLDVGTALSRRTGSGKVKFSNVEKVYWPKERYTKGDLIAYYNQVAETLLPYLHERPVHMLRYPAGITGDSFYQHQAPEHLPDWIQTVMIKSIRHILCNDRPTLLYMVNLGSIDLHPWLSRRESLDQPDWAVLDLDAKKASFGDAVKIARAAGKLLRGIGLRPYLKTSGATGLHIFIPLKAGYSYEQSRLFCEGVARIVASEHRDLATVERAVPTRKRGIYIDFLQNRRGQTVVPPYAVRPLAGATVSMPLDWDELQAGLHPSQFTIKTAIQRLKREGDLFRPTLTDCQDLGPAITRLDSYVKNIL